MGYELHITRADDWLMSTASPIPIAEWEAAARGDHRLIDVTSLGWDAIPPAATFVWGDEEGPSLYWTDGEIRIKGVRSDEEAGELAAFAAGLGAHLLGDDGERYDETGSPSD